MPFKQFTSHHLTIILLLQLIQLKKACTAYPLSFLDTFKTSSYSLIDRIFKKNSIVFAINADNGKLVAKCFSSYRHKKLLETVLDRERESVYRSHQFF